MRPSNLSKRRALGASGSEGHQATRHFQRYWPVGGAANVAVRSARSEWPLTALRPRCRASRRRSLDRTHSRRSGLSVRTGLDAPLRHCQDETATARSAPRPRLMISLSESLHYQSWGDARRPCASRDCAVLNCIDPRPCRPCGGSKVYASCSHCPRERSAPALL